MNESPNVEYIKLSHKLLSWRHVDDSSTFKMFVMLLLIVNHEKHTWGGMDCECGETFISAESLCKITHLAKSTLFRSLKKLEQTGEIKRERINGHMKTIVVNYFRYQSVKNEPTIVQKLDPNKNNINKNTSIKGNINVNAQRMRARKVERLTSVRLSMRCSRAAS